MLKEFKDELETNDDACMVDGEDSGGNNLFVFNRRPWKGSHLSLNTSSLTKLHRQNR